MFTNKFCIRLMPPESKAILYYSLVQMRDDVTANLRADEQLSMYSKEQRLFNFIVLSKCNELIDFIERTTKTPLTLLHFFSPDKYNCN